MNKKQTLAGCYDGGAILIAEKQTLFQSLFITLSQLEELDVNAYRALKDLVEDVVGATVEEEEKLREELNLMIDYDESTEFSMWESEYGHYLSGNQSTYVVARMLEYLILEDGNFWFNSEELKFRISNDLDFYIQFSTPNGFCFFSIIEDGGEF